MLLLAAAWARPAAGQEFLLGPAYADRLPRVEVVLEGWKGDDEAALPRPDRLTLVEDGTPTGPATAVEPFGKRGVAVVAVVDVSGTMAGGPLDEVRTALLALLDESGPHDRFALVSFADDIRVDVDFDDSRQQARTAIERLTHRGRFTELYRALVKSFDLFDSGGELPARRLLVVVSDGKDGGEAYRLEDVVELARQRRIPVDTLGLTRIDERHLSHLERLSRLTGGDFERAGDGAGVEALVRRGMERIADTPVAIFTAATWSADGQRHDLGVRLRQGNRLLSGETTVDLPPAAPPAVEDGAADGEEAGEADEESSWWPLAALAAGLAAAALVAILLVARTRRRAPAAASATPRPAATIPAASPPDASRPPPGDGPATGGDDGPRTTASTERAAEPAASAGAATQPIARKTQLRTVFPPPRPGAPSAVLVPEDDAGARFPIECSPFWIGADEAVDLRLPDDDYLSSHHASILFHEGSLLLYDNRSTNGTFVNDARLDAAPRTLSPGDRLRVGRSSFQLRRAGG